MANIRGTAANNNLVGTTGNDVIDGLAGADTMAGGLGNDVYVVDNIGDLVIENAGAGIDTVQANISYMLTANVENLQLTGTANINGTGNILNNSLTGNSGNNILDGGAGADTMAGGAGNDTYIVDNVGDVVTEANNQGTDNVQASVNHILAANIENLALIGAALIGTGNTLNNTITGNSANNTLNGGAGIDTLIGGLGNDTYIVDNAGDVVTEAAGAGIDSVQASASYVLGANVENLTLTGIANINGTGNALDNIITGNNGNNTLNGGAGNDTLNGGAGIDSLIGGTGNDTYIVDNAGDTITELVGEGTDTAQASVSYTLGATNIENLMLTGTGNINGTGNTLDNVITGNSGNNILNGGAGNDTLNGGLGLDNMIGGTGNDTFIVDNAGDVVTEAAGAGTDTAQASVSYVIGANVENLILTGTANINGTGNASNNTITGNSGNNILDGAAGADTLIGGLGDDTYIVDNAGDVITEAAGEGTDTVQTSSSYTLGATNIENLVLTGTGNINGTGNALDNLITGNSGNNILDGAAGIDTLIGGAGNDTYIVVDTDDVIIEGIGGGIDTVQASIDYTLGETEIENLTLIGAASVGTGNTLANTITGNALDNVLDGADGNDTLDGAGGSDILLGGFGDDTYIVNDTSALIIEGLEEGYDTVISSVDYALSADVENLTLVGIDAINGTGNELNNVIIGNAADNILNGGAGDDYLSGGAGNDTYVVDSLYDTVNENADEGLDTVESSDSYELGANIENLTLTGELAINGTGNALNNIITGNSSNSYLDGLEGADTMIGGAGSDYYVVDNVNDVVIEEPNGAPSSVAIANTDALGNIGYDTFGSAIMACSSDGRYIVFASDYAGFVVGDTNNVRDVFLKDIQTGAITRIYETANSTNTADQVVISRNGNFVAATHLDASTGWVTKLIDVITGAVSEHLGFYTDSVSDDGRYIAGHVYNNSTSVIFDTVTSSTVLAIGEYTDLDISSADGTKLVFSSPAGIEYYDATTNQISLLIVSPSTELQTYPIGISADGNVVLFTTDWTGPQILYTINIATGATTEVANLPTFANGYLSMENVAMSADGRFVVYDTFNGTFEIKDLLTGAIRTANISDNNSTRLTLTDDGNSIIYYSNDDLIKVFTIGDDSIDTVESSVDYTLGANIEILELYGNAINATGNELNNSILCGSQDNVINGGAGNDTLLGGAGNDTYIYNYGDGLDTIIDYDGLGNIIYRDADGIEYALTEGTRITGQSYSDATGRFVYDFNVNDSTLTVSLDGQVSMFLQNYSLAGNTLGIILSEPPPPIAPQIAIIDSVEVNQSAVNLVSTNSGGIQANSSSSGAIISANGRYIVFANGADNLASTDTNLLNDIFIKDLQTGSVTVVNTDSSNNQVSGNYPYTASSVSNDGRYVLFSTYADNLIPNDVGNSVDIFLKDMHTGAISRINVDDSGEVIANARIGDMSADGRYITFSSGSNNIATGDNNFRDDVFIKDMLTGNVTNITLGLSPSNFYYFGNSHISDDGNIISFATNQNLSVGQDVFSYNKSSDVFTPIASTALYDPNNYAAGAVVSGNGNFVLYGNASQLYVRNLITGNDVTVTDGVNGLGNGHSQSGTISADGRYVVFRSSASNLVADDTNGIEDVFIKDLVTNTILRLNLSQTGLEQVSGYLEAPQISADGRTIVFVSSSDNLVLTDTVGSFDVFSVNNPFVPINYQVVDGLPIVINNISMNDVDAGNNPLTVSLSVGNGSLSLLTSTGLTFTDADGSDGTIVFSGSLTNLNAALSAGVQYTVNSNFLGHDNLNIDVLDFTGLSANVNKVINILSTVGIIGTPNDDVLTGTSLNDIIQGLAGNDVITGGEGNDILAGGLGRNQLYGGDGNDILIDDASEINNTVAQGGGYNVQYLDGGLGDDTYFVNSLVNFYQQPNSPANLYIENFIIEAINGGGDTIVTSGSANLDYYFSNIENVTLQGSASAYVYGNSLNNTIIGNSGDNTIAGYGGADTLFGGAGNDFLSGETMTGGTGNDTFDLSSFANILDFGNGLDILQAQLGFNGVIATNQFLSGFGMTAGDGSQQFIYDTNNGNLYYEDGNDPDAALHVATLIGVPDLNYTNINSFYALPEF
jgi:trimeric autotransporter adhesin